MSMFWFVLCLFLIFIEITTVNLVSIWFAIGAFFAMLIALVTDSTIVQVIVFAVTSLIALLITKPLVKKIRKGEIEPTNYDRVIGKTAEVTKKITPNSYGEVKVLGAVWTATSDKVVGVGEKVLVKAVDGVKLVVLKEEKE